MLWYVQEFLEEEKMIIKCLNCGKEFYAKSSKLVLGFGKYCSRKCYFDHFSVEQRKIDIRRDLIRNCILCDKEFKLRPRDIVNGHGKCCSRSCAKKYFHILNPNIISGENSYFWKGGVTPLRERIRELRESKLWIKSVLKRDGYTCKECGRVGGVLNAHHNKDFSIILKEFLQYYNKFSPVEDKETLVRLAISWKPFWDPNNGKTLCKNCHSNTESYLKRK